MMEGKKTKPRAILVFGAPCSGKTTFAKNFAKRFNIPFYNLEEIRQEIGTNLKHTLQILELITKTQQNLIIEGLLDTEQHRQQIYNLLRKAGYSYALVWIQTDTMTIKKRLTHSLGSIPKAKELYEQKIESMEAPSEIETPIVLSGKHTFKTQLVQVLSRLS